MLLLHSHLNHWCLLVFGKIMNNMLFWVLYIDLCTRTNSLCCMVLLRTSSTSFLGKVQFFFQAIYIWVLAMRHWRVCQMKDTNKRFSWAHYWRQRQGGAAKKKSDMGLKFFLRTKKVGLTNYHVNISPYMVNHVTRWRSSCSLQSFEGDTPDTTIEL